MSKFVLASQSPRRIELLKVLGLQFEVKPSNIDENQFKCDSESELVLRLSYEKAFHCWSQLNQKDIVLGADTIVCIGNQILGKPKDKADAKSMLNKLSGKWHKVLTGISIISSDDNSEINAIQDYETTMVHFRELNQSEIEFYINTQEPFDKAGSYALQGMGGCFVDKIEGCYANVIGLPLAKTIQALRKKGITIMGY